MQSEFDRNKTLAENFITDVFIQILNLNSFEDFDELVEKEKIKSDIVLLNYTGKDDRTELKNWVMGVMVKMSFSKIGAADEKNALLSFSVYLDRPDVVTVMVSSTRSNSFNVDLTYFNKEPMGCLNQFMSLLDELS